MDETIDLNQVDLVNTMIPKGGIEIEIDGLGKLKVELPNYGLIAEIAQVYTIKCGKSTSATPDFLDRITVLELNIEQPYIKVAIAKK